jgi:hypothetical protein
MMLLLNIFSPQLLEPSVLHIAPWCFWEDVASVFFAHVVDF